MIRRTGPIPAFEALVIESAPKQIARQIREAILCGELKVDDRLPTEEELSAQFNVSRATIREALKRLASENLVVSRRGGAGGNFVQAPTYEDLRRSISELLTVVVSLNDVSFEDVIGYRFEIGLMACRLAVQNRSAADLAAMRMELEVQQSDDLSDVDFCASDVRFHSLIMAASGNPLLASSLSGVLEGLEPITNLALFRFRDRKIIVDQHARLIDHLEARSYESAASVLSEQVDYLSKTHGKAKLWKKARRARAGKDKVAG